MKPDTKKNLDEARKNLGRCAAKVSARRTKSRPLTSTEKEVIIALGTARDWIRWAATLTDLKFSSKSESRSARLQGITESVRFNQLWTAANALFARDSVLAIALSPLSLPSSKKLSEAKRFQLLYNFAGIEPCLQCSCLKNLNAVLSIECKADDLKGELKADGTPTMWEVIYSKYMRPEDRTRTIGKLIGTAIEQAKAQNGKVSEADRIDQSLPSADGPTVIYAARNWAVHGMLLTSFFRGSKQKYITFIDNITLLLSAALEGAARNLLNKL
jgi:hypothetical protein